MAWNSVSVPQGSKIFRVHNFTFMFKGANYTLEIDEFPDGTFTGHGEHATDKNLQIESVTGQTLESCLQSLIGKIEGRS